MRAFYERHPYPPPVDSLEKYRRLWQGNDARQRRRADYHLFWPARPYREDHSILIAGCGTSQAAKHALRWPAARVTGIDFSAASVRHTDELKRKHGLDNLQVHQLPLTRVSELGATFDQIVCTGVLHHLPDPDAGLQALRDVLAPGGVMHLMLYAPAGSTISAATVGGAAVPLTSYHDTTYPVAMITTQMAPGANQTVTFDVVAAQAGQRALDAQVTPLVSPTKITTAKLDCSTVTGK